MCIHGVLITSHDVPCNILYLFRACSLCSTDAWLTEKQRWFDEYIFWYSEPESTIIKLNLSSFFSPREACIVSVQYVTLQVHRHDHSLKMEFRFWKFQNMCSLKKKVTDPFCMIRRTYRTSTVPNSCHEVWQPINNAYTLSLWTNQSSKEANKSNESINQINLMIQPWHDW